MRRLRSSFTLLSTDETPPYPEETYDQSPESQFAWDELFSAGAQGFPEVPTPNYYQASPYPEYPFDGFYGQLSPKFNYPGFVGDGEAEADDLLHGSSASIEILPSDSEQSYADPHPYSEQQHQLQQRTQQPAVTPYGTVSVLMRHLVRVDVSPGGAVMVRNFRSGSTAAISATGERSCITHTNAMVYQDGHEVHVMTCQGRLAKICQRGVVFTSSPRSLAYLVDESGTKSTAERFVDLRRDFSLDVFNDFSEGHSAGDCYQLLSKSFYKPLANGDDVWSIGGTQLKQDRYGNIEVAQERRRRVITLLPTVDEISLQAAGFSATVGSYSKRYLSVEAEPSRRITAGFCGLTAKSGSQKAGIDRNGKVSIL